MPWIAVCNGHFDTAARPSVKFSVFRISGGVEVERQSEGPKRCRQLATRLSTSQNSEGNQSAAKGMESASKDWFKRVRGNCRRDRRTRHSIRAGAQRNSARRLD